MIIGNAKGQGYVAFSPGYVVLAYHLPEAQVFLSDDWLDSIRMDLVETLKKILLPGKLYRYRQTGEYDTASLRAPYRFIALMLNRIFGRANDRLFKLEWIPIIFHVATQGTVFNWDSLVSSSLSSCLVAALGGEAQKRSEFYMSSILIDCILCNQPFGFSNASRTGKECLCMPRIDHCGLTNTITITQRSTSTSLCPSTRSFSGRNVTACRKVPCR